MRILIMGKPRSGKTTLIKNILAALPNASYGGFFTEEIKENGIRVGFKIVTTFGEQGILSHQDYKSKYHISKYGVNISNLDTIGIDSLERAAKEKDLIVIDEIGKMEMCSNKFNATVRRLFRESKKTIIATIPISASIPLINELKSQSDVKVFDTGKDSIENIKKSCLELLKYDKTNKL
jgi:nucleoside-triphosphatase